MSKLFKEPLVQFLIGGLLLYLALTTIKISPSSEENPLTITINDEKLLTYLQFQNKAFNPQLAHEILNSLDEEGRKRLISEYIRDEVMVRGATALGLDNNDEIIRRRLIQKMDYIVQGFIATDTKITEEEVETHFQNNQDDYMLDAEATFTHIYFSAQKIGIEAATLEAESLLPKLNKDSVLFENSGKYGQRFHFLKNYVNRSQQMITDHFGEDMSEAIFSSTPSSTWIGPFISEYGAHLVLVKNIELARSPDLKNVAGRVLSDVRRKKHDEARSLAIKQLTTKYTIKTTDEAER